MSPCHEWHKQLFSYFHCISFKFPFCVLEMNIWSFPPEPVTNGPLKLRDTALCLWHCGIYRRKRSNSSAEREHEKVNTVSWRFTCLEVLFVSNVLTTNVLGQQSCTMFAFLEMIVLKSTLRRTNSCVHLSIKLNYKYWQAPSGGTRFFAHRPRGGRVKTRLWRHM